MPVTWDVPSRLHVNPTSLGKAAPDRHLRLKGYEELSSQMAARKSPNQTMKHEIHLTGEDDCAAKL